MQISYSNKFKKQYKKFPPKLQQQTKARIELWQEQPNHPLLRLHRLEGKLSNFYSINITGDIRALYEVIGKEVVIYQFIGTHSQLYG
jgi:addiction module RelE/StbE family toxin